MDWKPNTIAKYTCCLSLTVGSITSNEGIKLWLSWMHFVRREVNKYTGWFIVPIVFVKQSSKIHHSVNNRWIKSKRYSEVWESTPNKINIFQFRRKTSFLIYLSLKFRYALYIQTIWMVNILMGDKFSRFIHEAIAKKERKLHKKRIEVDALPKFKELIKKSLHVSCKRNFTL